MSALYSSSRPRRSTTTRSRCSPSRRSPAARTFAWVRSVTFGCVSAGRTQRTCASALPSVRHGKPSKRSHRTQRPPSGSASSRSTPTGRWNGWWPVRAKSSASCWMRGSCETAGYGNGPERRGSVGSSPSLPVDEVETLGLGVVGLEVVVGDRPRGRDAAVVADLAEVALAQAEEDRAVELRVAADEVLRVGRERRAVGVEPLLAGHVAVAAEDLARVPVLRLAREVAAALQQQDALAGRGEPVRERAAAGAGADDDDVVVLGHLVSPVRRGRSARSMRRRRRAAGGG